MQSKCESMIKRIISVTLVLILTLGVAVFAAPSSFATVSSDTDIFDEWYQESGYPLFYLNGTRQTSSFSAGSGDTVSVYFNISQNPSCGRYNFTNAQLKCLSSVNIDLNGTGQNVLYFKTGNMLYFMNTCYVIFKPTSNVTFSVPSTTSFYSLKSASASYSTFLTAATVYCMTDYLDIIHNDILGVSDRIDSFKSSFESHMGVAINYLLAIDNSTYSIDQNINQFMSENHSKNGGTYLGAKTTVSGSYISSNTSISSNTPAYFDFRISSYNQGAYKFTIPFRCNRTIDNESVYIKSLKYYINGDYQNEYYHYSFYSLPNANGIDVYVFDFLPWSTASSSIYTFEVQLDYAGTIYYNSGACKFFGSDSFIYSLLRMQFQINDLKEAIAPDNYLYAEHESQEVIDDTLDGFTGDGSAAIKKSQTSSMKGLSSDLQGGLDGGGSVGDATQVFSTDSDLWLWFSQDNKNNINNLYVPNNRANLRSSSSPSGDGWEIIDAISPNEEDYLSHLTGGDSR